MVLTSDTELSGPHSGAWAWPVSRLTSEKGMPEVLLKQGRRRSPSSFCRCGREKWAGVGGGAVERGKKEECIRERVGRKREMWMRGGRGEETKERKEREGGRGKSGRRGREDQDRS